MKFATYSFIVVCIISSVAAFCIGEYLECLAWLLVANGCDAYIKGLKKNEITR